MKEQIEKQTKTPDEPGAFDVCCLVLPLFAAGAASIGMALLPLGWVLSIFGLLLFTGLLIALTHHHYQTYDQTT